METPDELVKPIESLLSSGLSSFGFLGRTALAVGTSVDNALEGALDLVQTMGEVTMRATTGIDFGELDDEDEEDEDEERYSAEADGSHYDDLSSRSSSRADSAASNSRAASGRSSVRESSGRGRSTAAPTAPTATATAAAAAAAAKTQPLHKPSAAQTVDGGGKRPPTATSAAAVSPASGGGSGGGAAKVAPGGGALKNGVRRTGSPGFADFSEWPAEFLAPMPQVRVQWERARQRARAGERRRRELLRPSSNAEPQHVKEDEHVNQSVVGGFRNVRSTAHFSNAVFPRSRPSQTRHVGSILEDRYLIFWV